MTMDEDKSMCLELDDRRVKIFYLLSTYVKRLFRMRQTQALGGFGRFDPK